LLTATLQMFYKRF